MMPPLRAIGEAMRALALANISRPRIVDDEISDDSMFLCVDVFNQSVTYVVRVQVGPTVAEFGLGARAPDGSETTLIYRYHSIFDPNWDPEAWLNDCMVEVRRELLKV